MRIDKAKVRHPARQNEEQKEKSNVRSSAFTSKRIGEYYNIEVGKLTPFHKQARKHFDEDSLKQMAETIKVHGIRQPLTVIPIENRAGEYEIVSGERRLRAAKIAGLETVPCIIIHDQKAAVEIALIENVQRADLHPIELAKAYQQLLDEQICDNKAKIAEKLGVTKSSVTETMQLLTLPENVQVKILEENITNRSLFREIMDKDSPKKMLDTIVNYNKELQAKVTNSVKERKRVVLKVVQRGNSFEVEGDILKKMSDQEKNKIKNIILEMVSLG